MSLHQERRESCTHPNASARRFSQGYQVRINDSTDHRAPRILDGFAIFINDEGVEKKRDIVARLLLLHTIFSSIFVTFKDSKGSVCYIVKNSDAPCS